MSRKPRIHIPGGIYHVMLRGNGGQDIFFNGEDRSHFYLLLQKGVSRYGHRIHGFCCMTNHVHLLIQVAEIPLSKIMQNISFRYTRWINKQKKQTGHLFQGRFKAILVNRDQYLLELVRYIHLNPVRAGLVKKVEKYPWSSHATYLGLETLPWLTTDWVHGQFSRQRAACLRQYSQFIAEGVGETFRSEFHGGQGDSRILGEDDFIEKVLATVDAKPIKAPSLEKIIEIVCLFCEVKVEELGTVSRQRKFAEVRGIVGWLSAEMNSATLTQVAQKFNRDVSTISLAVRKVGEKRLVDEGFREELGLMVGSIT